MVHPSLMLNIKSRLLLRDNATRKSNLIIFSIFIWVICKGVLFESHRAVVTFYAVFHEILWKSKISLFFISSHTATEISSTYHLILTIHLPSILIMLNTQYTGKNCLSDTPKFKFDVLVLLLKWVFLLIHFTCNGKFLQSS